MSLVKPGVSGPVLDTRLESLASLWAEDTAAVTSNTRSANAAVAKGRVVFL